MQKQLELFENRLPYHVECKSQKDAPPTRLPREIALRQSYIRHNPKTLNFWFAYDVDRPTSGFDWQDRKVAPPNIIATSPANGHSHYFYGLEIPIQIGQDLEKTSKSLRYGSAVQRALRVALDADPSYNGVFSKNPHSQDWIVQTLESQSYSLDLLCDYPGMILTNLDRRTKVHEEGLGRNCSLFDKTRLWSYPAVREYWKSNFEEWHMAVRSYALDFNGGFDYSLGGPLPHNEVRNTAKSIAVYVWENMGPSGFIDWQKNNNKKSQIVRKSKAEEKRQMLLSFGPGLSRRELSRISGLPVMTISRLLSE